MRTILYSLIAVSVALLIPQRTSHGALPEEDRREGERVLAEAGVQAGLVVHLGCGDGRLTAALLASRVRLVHGLDDRADIVEAARRHLDEHGLYGAVTVEQWTRPFLPFVDNAVNLLVIERDMGVDPAEYMRVLAPRGVLLTRRGTGWDRRTKPVPDTIDEWTHYRYDASGNPVARDSVVGPPRRLQWVAGPEHARSHEYTASTSTLVSSGGRIFYVADLAPTHPLGAPAEWHIVARDAFNGLLLWTRRLDPWYSHLTTWTSAPRELQCRMVAAADRVYATLGYFGDIHALDAATGEIIRTYPQTAGTEEIIHSDGTLYAVVKDVDDEQRAEFARLAQLTDAEESPLRDRDTGRPLFKVFRGKERAAARSIMAFDAQSGDLRWRLPPEQTRGIRPMSLRESGGRVFFQAGETVCLNAGTGERIWAAKTDAVRTVSETHVICANNKVTEITALDAATGKVLWTQPATLAILRGAFIIGDALWLGGFKPFDNGRKKYNGPVWGPHFAVKRDLATGELLMTIDTENPGHHHRCYETTATAKYLLVGRRGTEFYDLATGEVYWFIFSIVLFR